jgi:hypothetical protein
VNTKVDMRFNVEAASWLPQRIREKLLQMVFASIPFNHFAIIQSCYLVFPSNRLKKQNLIFCFVVIVQEKNRINSEGELVITSTKTRTQK